MCASLRFYRFWRCSFRLPVKCLLDETVKSRADTSNDGVLSEKIEKMKRRQEEKRKLKARMERSGASQVLHIPFGYSRLSSAKVHPSRKIPAYRSVCVFIQAAFPRVMRMNEESTRSKLRGYILRAISCVAQQFRLELPTSSRRNDIEAFQDCKTTIKRL